MADGSDGCPLVSIIVPVFNGGAYLRESLDSILAQTHPRIEVIVMDDASTDGTAAVVASYGDRVQYHRQPRNRGIYANANDGIARARGEFVAVYHADDVYEPNIVEREVAFLERYPEAGAVFCLSRYIDADGRDDGWQTIPAEVRGSRPLDWPAIFNALLTFKNVFLFCPGCMVRAAVYRDVGVYRQDPFKNTADLDMWLRIAQKYPVGILEEYLFCYRHGHGNSSQRYHHLRTDAERFFPIMDLYLQDGGHAIATPEALAAYEAHRAEDVLMRAINQYILGQLAEARELLREVGVGQLLGSDKIQRGRLLILYLALLGLVRLPRNPLVARWCYRRWHSPERFNRLSARRRQGPAPPARRQPLVSRAEAEGPVPAATACGEGLGKSGCGARFQRIC